MKEEIRTIAHGLRAQIEPLARLGVRFVPRGPQASSLQEAAPSQQAPVGIVREPSSLLLFDAVNEGETPTLAQVEEELGPCTRCKLHTGRKNIVFGCGNPNADIVFVGEGPGEEEDRQGLPFVGRAGQLLTRIIEDGMKLRRGDVYICNIIKCRPPRNRDPERDEVASCGPFLKRQIRAVSPKAVVALGKPAASFLLGRNVPITRVRGTWHEYNGIPLMPTFHPAYLLRAYTKENRRAVWQDMMKVLDLIRA